MKKGYGKPPAQNISSAIVSKAPKKFGAGAGKKQPPSMTHKGEKKGK
jgi:hypothetical protein